MVFLCLHVPAAFLKHIVLSVNGLGIVSQVQRGGQTKLKEVAVVLHREIWSTDFPSSEQLPAPKQDSWMSAGWLPPSAPQEAECCHTCRCDG